MVTVLFVSMYYDLDFKAFKYGSYSRKSSEGEDRQVQSIPKQNRIIQELLDKDNLELIESFSEKKSAFHKGREAFSELVKATKANHINAWVCLDPTRLSRNAYDAGVIITMMDEGILHHIRTRYRIYFNNARDKKNLLDEFTHSKYDSDKKSEDVKVGLHERYLKRGLPSGKAFIGYLNNKTKEKGNRDWSVDQQNFPKVKLLFHRFLEGNDSISSITDYARNDLCLTTPRYKQEGGRLVARSFVHRMLIHPIAAGFFYAHDDYGQKKRFELDTKLPRIITEDEHFRILEILRRRTQPRTKNRVSLFSGILTGSDGSYMGPDHKYQVICDCKKKFAYLNKDRCPYCDMEIDKMKSPKYLSYVYYYNIKRRKQKGLTAKAIREDKILTTIVDRLEKDFVISSELSQWIIDNISGLKDKQMEADRIIIESREKQLTELSRKKKKLREMYTEDMITKEEFDEDMAELKTKLAIHNIPVEVIDWETIMHELFSQSSNILLTLRESTISDKKQALRFLGSNLVWDEENLFISNKKSIEGYINELQRLKEENPVFEPEKSVENKGYQVDFEEYRPCLLRFMDNVRTLILKHGSEFQRQ